MQEKTLLKLCFLCSIIGIVSLFFTNKFVQLEQVEISQLKEGMNYARVLGEIKTKYTSKTQTTFLDLEDESGTIKAVIFKGVSTNGVQKGDFVEIVGEVQEYKGEPELIVKKIRKL